MATRWVCSDEHVRLETAQVTAALGTDVQRDAIRLQRVLTVHDIDDSATRALQHPLLPGRSFMVVPLFIEALPRGMLLLAHPEPYAFQDNHLVLMTEAAETVALAIYHAQQYAHLQDVVDGFEEGKFQLAHDIRSPLSAAAASMQIITYILKSYELKPDHHEKIQEALKASHHSLHSVIQLAGDLLDTKKLQIGHHSIDYEALSMELLFDEVVTMLQILANQQHIMLRNEVEPRMLLLPGDNHLIRRLLINLTSNALRFTPSGGTVTLLAREDLQTNTMLLCVEDTGKGVALEDRERIFHPFVQGRDSSDKEEERRGAGLGLAICREIVQAHRGQIWVEDREGGGSRFCVRLPTDVEIPDDDSLDDEDIDVLF
jgi:signal transduction histidine kinase